MKIYWPFLSQKEKHGKDTTFLLITISMHTNKDENKKNSSLEIDILILKQSSYLVIVLTPRCH